MIWYLTFSQALLLFTVALIPVFLILLALSQRVKGHKSRKPAHTGTIRIALASILLVEFITIFLLHVPSFKTLWPYFVLLPLIAGFLLCALRWSSDSNRIQALILFSAILYHVALLYSPPFDISISERTSAMAKLTLEGRWDPSWQFLNPTYNPFPMDVDLFSTISMITSIPYISKLNDWVFYSPFIVAFDLVLYSLTKRVTGSQIAGVLAIFILASTPPANVLLHGPKWIGNMLVLISALAVIKAFEESSYRANIIVANVSYAVAILFHPSAAIGAFLPVGILGIGYLGKQTRKRGIWGKLFRSRLFLTVSALFLVATFARAIYTAGYLEGILPSLKNFVLVMFGYNPPAEELTAVYERAVNPVNAYAWSIPVALASALVIHVALKKRVVGGAFSFVMYFVGAGFAFLGLLSVMLKAGGFQSAMYPAFVFLIPAATVVGAKALRSIRVLAAITIVLMVLFVGIAITDPMLSSERYRETGAGNIAPRMEDHVEARFLVNVIPPSKTLMAQYEITSCFSYLVIAEDRPPHQYYTGSADLQRIMTDSVVRDKELLLGVMYIWPQRLLPNIKSHLAEVPTNVYYDSSRYTIFEKISIG